jgi:tetratricopeptide (TPR) repeat protein
MRTPAHASRSAASVAVTILVCSLSLPSSANAQESSLPPASGSASMQLAPEFEISVAGFEANLKTAVDANDLKAQALAIDCIGALYFTHREPGKALKYFQRMLAIVHKLDEPTAEATALSDIGAANFALGRNEDALDAFKQALPIWHKLGNSGREAAILGDIGEVFRALNDQDEALHFDQKALPIYQPA